MSSAQATPARSTRHHGGDRTRKGRPGHPYKTPSQPRPRMTTEEGLAAAIIHHLVFAQQHFGGCAGAELACNHWCQMTPMTFC